MAGLLVTGPGETRISAHLNLVLLQFQPPDARKGLEKTDRQAMLPAPVPGVLSRHARWPAVSTPRVSGTSHVLSGLQRLARGERPTLLRTPPCRPGPRRVAVTETTPGTALPGDTSHPEPWASASVPDPRAQRHGGFGGEQGGPWRTRLGGLRGFLPWRDHAHAPTGTAASP